MAIQATSGRTINVQKEIDEAVQNGGDFSDIFSSARSKGADFVYYTHPSFYGDKEQDVIVALNPDATLGNAQYQWDTQNNKPFRKNDKSVTITALREMTNWQELAFRKLKRGQSLKFDWTPKDIPAQQAAAIKARLDEAITEDDIKQAFEFDIKHYGPGDHPSGSSQDVHGDEGGDRGEEGSEENPTRIKVGSSLPSTGSWVRGVYMGEDFDGVVLGVQGHAPPASGARPQADELIVEVRKGPMANRYAFPRDLYLATANNRIIDTRLTMKSVDADEIMILADALNKAASALVQKENNDG